MVKNKTIFCILFVFLVLTSFVSAQGGGVITCGKANYEFCDNNSECCSNNCCNGICLSDEECVVTGDDLRESEKTIITKGENTIFLEFINKDGEEYYSCSKRILVFCYDVPTGELGLCEEIYSEREYVPISELGNVEDSKIILETQRGANIIIDISEYKISFVEEDGNVIETEFIHDGERFKMSNITGVSQGRTDYGSYIYQPEPSYKIFIYYLKNLDTIPPEINILTPQDGSTIKGDFTSLVVETDENAVCEYGLGFGGPNYGAGSAPKEMETTGTNFHTQTIENLHETQEDEHYKISVTCTDESGNSNTASTIFYVDLSELREILILENIGDYDYSKSTMMEIPEGEYGGISTMYYGYYNKNNDENIYAVSIIEVEDISLIEESLEGVIDAFDLIIQNINGQYVYVSDTEDLQYTTWVNGKFIISVMVFSLEMPEPMPLQLVEAYLEKYPSDLNHNLNEILILEDIGNFEYVNSYMEENVDDKIVIEYGAEYYNNIDKNFYDVEIYELVDESLFEELLEEIQDYLSVEIINGQEVYFLDEGDNDYAMIWSHENLIIGVAINNLGEGEEPLFSQLVEAYLEKYPSDLDTTAPTIELISPEDDYVKKTSKLSYEIDFKFKVSDESEIAYCELIIDGDVWETKTDIQKGVENVFSVELDRGSYDWQIKCVDSEGNEGSSEIRDLRIKKKSSDNNNSIIVDNEEYSYEHVSLDNKENLNSFIEENIESDKNEETSTSDYSLKNVNLIMPVILLMLIIASFVILALIIFIVRKS